MQMHPFSTICTSPLLPRIRSRKQGAGARVGCICWLVVDLSLDSFGSLRFVSVEFHREWTSNAMDDVAMEANGDEWVRCKNERMEGRRREANKTKVGEEAWKPRPKDECALQLVWTQDVHGKPEHKHPLFQLELCTPCQKKLSMVHWEMKPRKDYPGYADTRCRCCGRDHVLQHCLVEKCNHRVCKRKPFARDHFCAMGICETCLNLFWGGDHREMNGGLRLFWRCPFCRHQQKLAKHESPHLCVEDWAVTMQDLNGSNRNLLEAVSVAELERSIEEPTEPVVQESGNPRKREPRFANINELCAEQSVVEAVENLAEVSDDPLEMKVLPAVDVTSPAKRPRTHADSLDATALLGKCPPEAPCTQARSIENVLASLGERGKEAKTARANISDFWETIDLLSSSDEDGEFLPLRRKVRAPKMSWPVNKAKPTRTPEQLKIFLAPYESWCRDPDVKKNCPTLSDPALLTRMKEFEKPAFEWPKFLYEQVFVPSKNFTGEDWSSSKGGHWRSELGPETYILTVRLLFMHRHCLHHSQSPVGRTIVGHQFWWIVFHGMQVEMLLH